MRLIGDAHGKKNWLAKIKKLRLALETNDMIATVVVASFFKACTPRDFTCSFLDEAPRNFLFLFHMKLIIMLNISSNNYYNSHTLRRWSFLRQFPPQGSNTVVGKGRYTRSGSTKKNVCVASLMAALRL